MKNTISNRRELKYYINYIDYFNLSNIISRIFSKDSNSNKDGGYHVRSLYFDNKANKDYYQKIDGIERRKKFRIRIYNYNFNPIKMEIKSKLNNYIIKESFTINNKDAEKIISGDYEILLKYKNVSAIKIYRDFLKDFYRPVVLIDYWREAYNYDLNQIRVTFDMDLKKIEKNIGDLFISNYDMSHVLNNNKIIMEIKFNNTLPSWIKNLIQMPRFERCAISKYTLSRYMEG